MFDRAELQKLWQGKEYRNFPVEVIDYITSDISICADARMCWIRLFKDAYFYDEWCIQISKNELKEDLNKGKSSIHRYLKDLEEAGYIDIENIIGEANRIFVRVPDKLYAILQNSPDRKKAIKQCGTVIPTPLQDCNTPRVTSERGGDVKSETPKNNINNYIYNNNNTQALEKDRDAESLSSCSSEVVVNSVNSSVKSVPVDKPSQDSKHIVTSCEIDAEIGSIRNLLELQRHSSKAKQKDINSLENELAGLLQRKEKMMSSCGAVHNKLPEPKQQSVESRVFQDLNDDGINLFSEIKVSASPDVVNQRDELKAEIDSVKQQEQAVYNELARLRGREHSDRRFKLLDDLRPIQQELTELNVKLQNMPPSSKVLPAVNTIVNGRCLERKHQNSIQKAVIKQYPDKLKAREILESITNSVLAGSLSKTSYVTKQQMSVDYGVSIALNKVKTKEWRVN